MPKKTKLEAAYRATTYRVFLPQGGLELRIDTANPALAAWLAANGVGRWAILTAFNPRSEQKSMAENLERQSALEVDLLEKGFEPFAGENVADENVWPPEESCFVPAIDLPKAMALASQFGQNAIVYGEADSLPTLVWIEQEE